MPDDRILDPDEVIAPVEPKYSPVTFNAVKHGILSVSPVIPLFETEKSWRRFQASIFAALKPQDGLQLSLADRAATLLWRLMRITRFEREVVTTNLKRVRADIARADRNDSSTASPLTGSQKDRIDQVALSRLIPTEADLAKITTYESRLHRQLRQTIDLIRTLQGLPATPQRDRRRKDTDVSDGTV